MKSLRVLVLAALCGFVFSACGGDDTPAPTDAGTPVDMPTVPPDLPSIDAGADDAAADDAGPDRDASADIDAGPEDAGPTGDDAGPSDAGREDAGSDLGVDAGALDAGPPPPVRDVDILFMVDNSGSMAEEQASLAAQLPRLVQVLTSGDRTGDGPTPDDFTPIRDLHLGVVTSDMGVGGFTVPSCSASPAFGDDGVLRTQGNPSDPSCMATYPSFLAYVAGAAMETPGEFGARFGCVAVAGTTGCGFEQQLEATLLALSPSAPTSWTAAGWTVPSFLDGRAPRGDGSNAGFLRPSSILAVVEVTDENDTSVIEPGLFDPADVRFSAVPLNLRGHVYSDPAMGIVQPVSRYADGLAGLRANPANLVFAAITGVPSGAIADAAHVDYAALAADTAMMPTVNTDGTGLEPSCSSDNGVAFPPTRLVETARELDARGAGTVLASICDPTFDALIDGLIERIAARAAGSCE